jgi:hypothetical protein
MSILTSKTAIFPQLDKIFEKYFLFPEAHQEHKFSENLLPFLRCDNFSFITDRKNRKFLHAENRRLW